MKIINKPWGHEELLEINDNYVLKKLTMHKGHRCSLQYHNIKRETIYVLKGKLRIYTGLSKDLLTSKIFEPSKNITLAPGVIHRMEAIDDCVYLEASTPELTDVVRIADDYERLEQ